MKRRKMMPAPDDWRLLLAAIALLLATHVVGAQDKGQDQDREDESKQRLIRRARGEQDGDIMSEIMRQMQEVGTRLDEFFDVGQETQHKQEDILDRLDEAIEQAKQNMRAQHSNSSGESDDRPEGDAADQDAAGGEQADSGTSEEAGEGAGGDEVEAAQGSTLHERQRQWGNLPRRDREEVLQGQNDDVLEKYRELVNKYYEALAKPPEEQ